MRKTGFIERWRYIMEYRANPSAAVEFPGSLTSGMRIADGMLAVLLFSVGQYHPRVTRYTEHWWPRHGDIHHGL